MPNCSNCGVNYGLTIDGPEVPRHNPDECIAFLQLQLRDIVGAAYEFTLDPTSEAKKGTLMGLVQKRITDGPDMVSRSCEHDWSPVNPTDGRWVKCNRCGEVKA